MPRSTRRWITRPLRSTRAPALQATTRAGWRYGSRVSRQEVEGWRLFWLFPHIVSEPRGFNTYLVEINAAGRKRSLIVLPELLREQVGTEPLSNGVLPVTRYMARVMLPATGD